LITQSGTDARDVVGLVFVAAFAPEADEKLADINARYPDIPRRVLAVLAVPRLPYRLAARHGRTPVWTPRHGMR
jgi:hypothetical protein